MVCTQDGQGPVELTAGSTAVFLLGRRGEWDVTQTLRKVFAIYRSSCPRSPDQRAGRPAPPLVVEVASPVVQVLHAPGTGSVWADSCAGATPRSARRAQRDGAVVLLVVGGGAPATRAAHADSAQPRPPG